MRPTLHLSLLAFLLLQLHSHANADCEPATCGNLTLRYPFWLGDSKQQTPSPCGPPAFEIWCAERSVASLRYTSFHVLDIDYANNSLIVSNTGVAAATHDGVCNTYFNMSINLSFGPFTIGHRNRALCFLHNCNGTAPSGPGYVNATSNCSAPIYAYLGGTYHWGKPPPEIATGGCTYSYLPVLVKEAEITITAANYSRLLKDGFVLEWEMASVGDCGACAAIGGQCRYNKSMMPAFWCLCPGGGLAELACAADQRKKQSIKLTFIVVLSAPASLILTCLVWLMYRKKEKHILLNQKYIDSVSNIEKILKGYDSLIPKRYKYSELKKITRSFKDKLGEGGYGIVFKGTLEDGRDVAVKLLKQSKGNGDEFLNEVVIIHRTSHVNIVNLLGFCLHGSKRALIYEYMANDSLEKYIYSEETKRAIGWVKLREIAIGIARGLEYLHRGCNTRIIHFDIKPHNILLDEDFCPKIADFGLAKLCHLKDSALSMAEARGTIGFIAPEVFSRGFGVVSTKSDVYSYGMLLLEMVGGRTNAKESIENSSEAYFPNWVYDRLVKDLQSHEVTCETEDIARQMTLVGLWCIQTAPGNRPSMSRVIEMLEKNINELEMPPKPLLSCPAEPSNFSS